MKTFLHQVKFLDNTEGNYSLVAEKNFSKGFNRAAYLWFQSIAIKLGFTRSVKDTSIAGKHYTDPNGFTLELW